MEKKVYNRNEVVETATDFYSKLYNNVDKRKRRYTNFTFLKSIGSIGLNYD